MCERGEVPALVVSSPARRALATARLMAAELGIALEEIVIDDLERIMAVNVKGMFNCARHAVPMLRTACNNCLTVFMWSSVA